MQGNIFIEDRQWNSVKDPYKPCPSLKPASLEVLEAWESARCLVLMGLQCRNPDRGRCHFYAVASWFECSPRAGKEKVAMSSWEGKTNLPSMEVSSQPESIL